MASRLTFREKCPTVCWQKQLRDKYLAEGCPPVPHLDVKRAIVRPISRRLAEQVILKYEWLGTMSGTSMHFGIFFGPFCAGVTCVALGGGTGSVNAHRPFDISRDKLGILARGACVHWAPRGTNSRLVAWTARAMKKENCRIVLAYSDADAGEVGTIYQACGWTYLGRGGKTQQWVSPSGRVVSSSLEGNLRRSSGKSLDWCRSRLKRDGWKRQYASAKGRYVCVLDKTDKALAARIEAMRQPYPKRAGSVASDTSPIQGEEGGATPTPALC